MLEFASLHFLASYKISSYQTDKRSKSKVPNKCHHLKCRVWGQDNILATRRRRNRLCRKRTLTWRPAHTLLPLLDPGLLWFHLFQEYLWVLCWVLGYSSECLPLSRREPWGPTSGPQCPGNWIPHLVKTKERGSLGLQDHSSRSAVGQKPRSVSSHRTLRA